MNINVPSFVGFLVVLVLILVLLYLLGIRVNVS